MTDQGFLLDTNVAIGYLSGSNAALNLIDKSGAAPANSSVSQSHSN